MENKNICPNCGSTEHVNIHASGSEYTSLIAFECGCVYLSACINCGTVYLDKHYVERIRNNNEARKKRSKV